MDLNNATPAAPDSNFCLNIRQELEVVSDPFYREPNTRIFVTVMYSSVACMGAIGNLFVITAVARNPLMRTPRNYFIINLALSDFLMCTLTVPFTLYYVLNTFWNLGSTACKLVASAQGVNIFVSAMSITAIGLDRYWVILFPTKTQQQRLVVVICFLFIWIFSFLLAFPLFYATDTQFPAVLEPVAPCGVYLLVCSESWDKMVFDKRVYTISSTAFQYVLPLTMLTFVYARIIWRLENRVMYRQRANAAQIEQSIAANGNVLSNSRIQNRRRSMEVRQRRMNSLLICVVAFFAFCWLPLNVYNALLSFDVALYNVVAFSSCHVFGMTSACANPVLYGVLNENFRQEFVSILTCLRIIPVVRYVRKLIRAGLGRAGHSGGDTDDGFATGAATGQQLTSLRSSMRTKLSQGTRRNSGRLAIRSGVDDCQKLLLDVPPTFVSSMSNGSVGTGTHCPPTPTPFSESGIGLRTSHTGDSFLTDQHSPANVPQIALDKGTPEENTPLVFDSPYRANNGYMTDSAVSTYALVTDL